MVQPFECTCNERDCLGMIMGASELGKDALKKYWLNTHIEERLESQAEGKMEYSNGQGGRQNVDSVDQSVMV